LKAQFEVNKNLKQEAQNYFEKAIQIIPLADRASQRRFYCDLQDRWNEIAKQMHAKQCEIIKHISGENISTNKKLQALEEQLDEVRTEVNKMRRVLRTKEDLDLHIEKIIVLSDRNLLAQDDIIRIGFLSLTDSEKVGILLTSSRCIQMQIDEELESAQLLKEKMQSLQRGLDRLEETNKRLSTMLDECENNKNQGSELVDAAVNRCLLVDHELKTMWQDIMTLRQNLHSLPTGMKVTISPKSINDKLCKLQDEHSKLKTRCLDLVALLSDKLKLWQKFEMQLDKVQQSVRKADYMMEILTIQGSVNYDRLLKATERLEVSYFCFFFSYIITACAKVERRGVRLFRRWAINKSKLSRLHLRRNDFSRNR